VHSFNVAIISIKSKYILLHSQSISYLENQKFFERYVMIGIATRSLALSLEFTSKPFYRS